MLFTLMNSPVPVSETGDCCLFERPSLLLLSSLLPTPSSLSLPSLSLFPCPAAASTAAASSIILCAVRLLIGLASGCLFLLLLLLLLLHIDSGIFCWYFLFCRCLWPLCVH